MRIIFFVLFFCAQSFAILCETEENFWLSRDALFFGKKKLTDDLNPIILKVPADCKRMSTSCTPTPQFAKSKRHVFYREKEVPGADPASFEYICDDFARDKYKVYKKDQIFIKSQPQSFSYDEVSGVYRFGKKAYTREGKLTKLKDRLDP